ncbi:MAG: hypothetical protein MK479_04025 [Planctomycetes bacterium]|nr:hypothetical protein [Planctomycetota bacterium]
MVGHQQAAIIDLETADRVQVPAEVHNTRVKKILQLLRLLEFIDLQIHLLLLALGLQERWRSRKQGKECHPQATKKISGF